MYRRVAQSLSRRPTKRVAGPEVDHAKIVQELRDDKERLTSELDKAVLEREQAAQQLENVERDRDEARRETAAAEAKLGELQQQLERAERKAAAAILAAQTSSPAPMPAPVKPVEPVNTKLVAELREAKQLAAAKAEETDDVSYKFSVLQEQMKKLQREHAQLQHAHDQLLCENVAKADKKLRPSVAQSARNSSAAVNRPLAFMGDPRDPLEPRREQEGEGIEALHTTIDALKERIRKRDGQVQTMKRELNEARDRAWELQQQAAQVKKALKIALEDRSEVEGQKGPLHLAIADLHSKSEDKVCELRTELASTMHANAHLAEVARQRQAFIQMHLSGPAMTAYCLSGGHPAGLLLDPRIENLANRIREERRLETSGLIGADESPHVMGNGASGPLLGRPGAAVPYRHDSWNAEPNAQRSNSVEPDLDVLPEDEEEEENDEDAWEMPEAPASVGLPPPPPPLPADFLPEESDSDEDPEPWGAVGPSAPEPRKLAPLPMVIPALPLGKVRCGDDDEDDE
mmetsp:Transcript_34974/g.80036  ORF Transcript_34974/g.80036 Transcript_34974/m.80036 type:complete len:517 (+) Transcript_34974:541-2091(+)